MFEARADGSNLERVFRVGDRPLYSLAFYLTLATVMPVLSLYELVTTGTIDMDAVSRGRLELPMWSLYLGGWLIFVAAMWAYRPHLRYFVDSEMFRLNEHGIVVCGVQIAPEEVLGFRYSFLRGHVLQSARGDFPIHPWMIKGAVEALAEAFPHIPPIKQGNTPRWLMGD